MSTAIRIVLGAAFLLVLAACSRQATGDRAVSAAGMAARVAPEMAAVSQAAGVSRSESLAYEHIVSIELGKQLLPERMRELQTACASSKDLGCTLLDVSVSTRTSRSIS